MKPGSIFLIYQKILRYFTGRRSSMEVVRALGGGAPDESSSSTYEDKRGTSTYSAMVVLLSIAALGFFLRLLTRLTWDFNCIAPVLICGLGAGFLFFSVRKSKHTAHNIREIDFYLPVVMERIVMAVEAGLDLLPALEAATDTSKKIQNLDAVSTMLQKVVGKVQRGVPFELALKSESDACDSSALRHAFVHLAMAHRQGGQIVAPLRELSNSTQLYFQETIEEWIATLPVRATLPLLCTFGGLIVCFVTMPLIQIAGITQDAIPLS